MRLDALVAPLRADVVSGASTIAADAADVILRAIEEEEYANIGELRQGLGDLGIRILEAQPSMAPLVHLVSVVMFSAESAGEVHRGRRSVLETASAFQRRMESAAASAGRRAETVLPKEGRVLTISASTMVRTALGTAAEEGHRLEAICLEGRPACEGRMQARRLAEEGIPVTYAVDAAGWRLAGESDVVLIGADSIGDRGVVNKIGSRSVAAAARDTGIPVYVVAGRTKLLPAGLPQPVDDDREESEVWESPPEVRTWNRYFERLPLELVDAVVVEDAVLDPDAVDRARRDLPVPHRLRQWAENQAGTGSRQEPE